MLLTVAMETYKEYEPDNADLDGLARSFSVASRFMSFRAPPDDDSLVSPEHSMDLGGDLVILDDTGNTMDISSSIQSKHNPLDQIRQKVCQYCETHTLLSHHLPSLFMLFDTSKTNKITPVDFAITVSRRLDLDLLGSDITSLFAEFDEDKSGDLNVNEFASLLNIPLNNSLAPSSPSRPSSALRNTLSAMGVDMCVDMLRSALGANKSLTSLSEIFHELDQQKRNCLSVSDLYEGINFMMNNKQLVSMSQCEYIMARFDLDKSSDLSFDEFLLLLGVQPENGVEVCAVSANDLESKIQAAAHEYLALNHNAPSKLKDLFAYFDPVCKSRVNKCDLRQNMAKLFSIGILPEELDALFLKYDVDKSGDLNYGEFLSLIGCKRATR
ncbi:hypothetical protein EON65_41830 [archaeon]|nr:MAG: hypothetical protein EON65_41830 [archaeon]